LGLTDLNKTEYGSDHELSAHAMDSTSLRAKLRKYRPAAVAFTSKNAASIALGVKQPSYGRQVELLEGAVVFVLASPSGRARSFWTIAPWKQAAAFVLARRQMRERAA
jgi:TDG/mug DNA glycosylase family protein